MIGISNDKTNFSRKLSLIDTEGLRIRKAFSNGSSTDINFSKTQLSKTVQLGRFILDLPDIFNLPTKGVISLVNSVAKEKKMGAKKIK